MADKSPMRRTTVSVLVKWSNDVTDVCILQNDDGAWHQNGGLPAVHVRAAGSGWGSGVPGRSDMLA